MPKIKATLKGSKLNISEAYITSGSAGVVECEFEFDADWDGLSKTAVFFQNAANTKFVALGNTETECLIPWETLITSRPLYIGVFGTSGGNRLTSSVKSVVIETGSHSSAPTEPTADVYEQILDLIEQYRNDNAQSAIDAEQFALAAAISASGALASEGAAAISAGNANDSALAALASMQTAQTASETAESAAERAYASAAAALLNAVAASSSEQAALGAKSETLNIKQDVIGIRDGIVVSEGGRVSAEGLRVAAETGRGSAESARVLAEADRVSAEGLRTGSEVNRVAAEGLRVSAESGRNAAEILRVSAEGARAASELLRVSAESDRDLAEQARNSAEEQRAENEIGRGVNVAKNTNDIRRLEQSLMSVGLERITASDVGEVDIPANALQAPCRYKIYGNEATNLTNWGEGSQVLTTPSRGLYRGTGDGSFSQPNFIMSLPGFVYYCIKMSVKVTNSSCQKIRVARFYDGNLTILTEVDSPEANRVYDISLKHDWDLGGYLIVYHIYDSAAMANGKVMEMIEPFVIKLNWMFNQEELPIEVLEKMFNDWFDGDASVVAPRLRSIDENGKTIAELYHTPIELGSDRMYGEYLRYIENGIWHEYMLDTSSYLPGDNIASGLILSSPNGKVIAEPYIADVGILDGDNLVHIFNEDYLIDEIESVSRLNPDGSLYIIENESLPLPQPDKKSFSCYPGMTPPAQPFAPGDIILFTYKHSVPTLSPLIDIEYLNSDKVRLDTETGTPYRLDWKVANGELILTTEEVV